MRRVQGDDGGAFGPLYDRFARRVYNVGYGLAHDPGHAEDARQETFVSIWRSRADFDPGKGP